MRWICCAVLWLALCAIPPSAYGQASAPGGPQDQKPAGKQPGDFRDFDELDLEDLLNVTVSIAAGRVQRAEEAPSIVSVVTDEDIRRMGARTLADVLETVPGFEVLTDSLGRNHIAVRGIVSQRPTTLAAVTQASSENILVLFNGHRLNDHFTGGATVVNLDIPLYNIKQVEIVRGPGSALFGANAFLAVINLVPYTARNFEGIEVSAAGGSFDTQQYNVLAARTFGSLGLSTSFQFSDTSGPRLLVPRDFQSLLDELPRSAGLPPISLAPRTTSGDRRGVDFSLNATYKGLQLNARVRDERGDGFIGFRDIFGGGKDELDSQQILLDAGQTFTLTPRTSLAAKASFTQNKVRDFLSLTTEFPGRRDFLDFSTNSRRYAGELGFDHQISTTNRLTVGVGYESESTYDPNASREIRIPGQPPRVFPYPSTVLPVTSRRIASVFMQDTWDLSSGLGLTAGVRYDGYNDFGGTVNPRAGIVWRLPKRLHVKALYGRAFRAPTLTELFVDLPTALIKGNLDLEPSTINTVEAAVGYKDRDTRVSVTYFTNNVRDFIVGPVPLIQDAVLLYPGTFVNSPPFTVQGVEIDLKRTFGFDHAVFANYAYRRATGPSIDSPLGRYLNIYGATPGVGLPSNAATLGLTVGVGRHLSVTPTALLRGERPRHSDALQFFNDSRPPVPAYGVVNLNVRVKELFDRLEVAGTIGNLFDKRYVDPAPLVLPGDYPRPGRNGLVTVTYKF
jgi:iron complex outermembrane receptor protein